MNGLTDGVITALGYLTLFGQILIAVLVLLFIFQKNKKVAEYYPILRTNALTFAFIVASIATLGSLFLSEVAHFVPCKLCWFQRIFMYPTALILFVSLITSDKKVTKYVLPLAGIGGLVAAYHYIMQLFPEALECSEEVAKCSTIQFAEFGYITIPLMSLTAFVLITLLALISRE